MKERVIRRKPHSLYTARRRRKLSDILNEAEAAVKARRPIILSIVIVIYSLPIMEKPRLMKRHCKKKDMYLTACIWSGTSE